MLGGMAVEKPLRKGDYDSLYKNYIAVLKEVDHLSTLREIALAINSTIELEEILPTIAYVVQGALDIRKLTIYELAPGGIAVPVIAKFGRDLIKRDRLEGETVHVEGTPFGDAIATRMPVLLNSDYNSGAYVPLFAKNVAVGVMRLEDHADGSPFRQEDTSLFQAIGSMIAIAINNAQLYALAVTDGLTGLYVRRYFDLRMDEEIDQAARYERSFSLMMIDIDHFKKFNDAHGHQTGDMVLQQFAQILRDNTRKSDICCRYGGEEMSIILPETTISEAAILANKLCGAIRDFAFTGTAEQALSVTASIGVAAYGPEYKVPAQMVEAADQCLYRAKELGRNRVELAL